MASLSTHVLDSAEGGPRPAVVVEVHDESGQLIASGVTDERGRVEALASDIRPGRYRMTWTLAGPFITSISVAVDLSSQRHYHVPLVASGYSSAVYLGA